MDGDKAKELVKVTDPRELADVALELRLHVVPLLRGVQMQNNKILKKLGELERRVEAVERLV